MFMRTDRLFLRPIFPEDWREVYRGIADFRIVRMLARAPWPYRPADAVTFCRKPAAVGSLRCAITLPELSGAPIIGMIGIDAHEDGAPELGYWIGTRWQGRGYATEAAIGIMAMADALGIENVEAGHYLENPASGKVLRAAGFVDLGEMRPTACAARGGEMVLTRRYARSQSAMADAQSQQAA